MMDVSVDNDFYTLEGQEAIDLWLAGDEAWNAWVSNNNLANVDFEGLDFGEIRKIHDLDWVSFRNYKFPVGIISFQGAKFGDRAVEFVEAQFGDGYVNFERAKFGEGPVRFQRAQFGDGLVRFQGAQFGDGAVDFYEAQFGDGEVNFSGAKFGDGEVSFERINKGKGAFNFTPQDLFLCKKLNFSNATLGSFLSISDIDSPAVLNLQHTKLSYPIDFDNANIRFRSAYHYLDFQKAIEKSDSTSFRRLKKLAKDADDHERALDFFAKEMRSAYWHSITGPKLAVFYLYDWISDYGRSIFRPLVGLLVTVFLYAQLYTDQATVSSSVFLDALKFSMSHVLPIYPGVREVHQNLGNQLFGGDLVSPPWWLMVTITSQYVLSTMLLFLLGLALRNRFRT